VAGRRTSRGTCSDRSIFGACRSDRSIFGACRTIGCTGGCGLVICEALRCKLHVAAGTEAEGSTGARLTGPSKAKSSDCAAGRIGAILGGLGLASAACGMSNDTDVAASGASSAHVLLGGVDSRGGDRWGSGGRHVDGLPSECMCASSTRAALCACGGRASVASMTRGSSSVSVARIGAWSSTFTGVR